MSRSTKAPQGRARQIIKQLKLLNKLKGELIWEEARLWRELKRNNLYKEVGSWKKVSQLVGVSLSTAELRERVFSYWVEKLGISPKAMTGLDIKTLDRTIPYLKKGGVKPLDALFRIKEMPREEFIRWLEHQSK